MKQLLTFLLSIAFSLSCFAQNSKNLDNIVIKSVPKKLSLKDKIVIENKSSFTIEQITVALLEKGKFIPISTAKDIHPSCDETIINYRDNELKKLKGKDIAIKAKGTSSKGVVTYKFNIELSERHHDLYITMTSDEKSEVNPMDF